MNRLGRRFLWAVLGLGLVLGGRWLRIHFLGSPADDTVTASELVSGPDAELYLRVLRATAQRVRSPHPEELRAVEAFKGIPNAGSAKASQLNQTQRDQIYDAIRLTEGLDEIVARDIQVDLGRYEKAKEAIESLIEPADDRGPVAPELSPDERTGLAALGPEVAAAAEEIKRLFAETWNSPLRRVVEGR